MIQFPKTSKGQARLATEEEIAKEDGKFYYVSDLGFALFTDDEECFFIPNVPEFGYTHPNIHRRIDLDPIIEPGQEYPWIYYDSEGNPYKQNITLGTWDGINSYRTTETITHDEESTTCEIP